MCLVSSGKSKDHILYTLNMSLNVLSIYNVLTLLLSYI